MTCIKIGHGGSIAGHDVLVLEDGAIFVTTPEGRCFTHHAPNYGTAIDELAKRPGFRLGWARMVDDAEILFFYDRDDGNFGYALNVTDESLSEWGYAPFEKSDDEVRS